MIGVLLALLLCIWFNGAISYRVLRIVGCGVYDEDPTPFETSCDAYGWLPRNPAHRTPQIIHTVMLLAELDQLEIKLHELYPVIDWFVILESHYTFHGDQRPIAYDANDPRWAPYKDKILHHIYEFDVEKAKNDHWYPEKLSRTTAHEMLKERLQAGDLILNADLDEIPRRESMALLKRCQVPSSRFPMNIHLGQYYYSMAFREHDPWWKAVVTEVAAAQGKGQGLHDLYKRGGDDRSYLENAGWHLTWAFPRVEDYIYKLETISHEELNRAEFKEPKFIQECLCTGRGVFRPGTIWPAAPAWQMQDAPKLLMEQPGKFPYLRPGYCLRPPPLKQS